MCLAIDSAFVMRVKAGGICRYAGFESGGCPAEVCLRRYKVKSRDLSLGISKRLALGKPDHEIYAGLQKASDKNLGAIPLPMSLLCG